MKPAALANQQATKRASDKLLLDDVIKRAKARNGYVGVSKYRNPKLGYYWLELSVMPFMLGDTVGKDNKGEVFLYPHSVRQLHAKIPRCMAI